MPVVEFVFLASLSYETGGLPFGVGLVFGGDELQFCYEMSVVLPDEVKSEVFHF